MPLVDRDELRQKSRPELKKMRGDVQEEISRLIDASEAANEELEDLEKRARKGDPAASDQIEDQRQTCKDLRGELRDQKRRREAISDVLGEKPDLEGGGDGDGWDSQRRKKYGL